MNGLLKMTIKANRVAVQIWGLVPPQFGDNIPDLLEKRSF